MTKPKSEADEVRVDAEVNAPPAEPAVAAPEREVLHCPECGRVLEELVGVRSDEAATEVWRCPAAHVSYFPPLPTEAAEG
jgi:hypothetical protein